MDEQRLLAAAASVPAERLTAAERERNKLGDMLIFEHKPGASRTSSYFFYLWYLPTLQIGYPQQRNSIR